MENQVLKAIASGENIFITGGAGVGKSYLSRKIAEKYPSMKMTASTGIAALNIGGSTVHSFFGVGKHCDERDVIKMVQSQKWEGIAKKIQYARIVLIDEVSMIRGDLLNLIDMVCRMARLDIYHFRFKFYNGKIKPTTEDEFYEFLFEEAKKVPPFGKLQMVFVGDFLQLPPVVRQDEKDDVKELFAFESRAWREAKIKVFNLTKVYRQSDKNFIDTLNAIRIGEINDEQEEIIKKTLKNKFPLIPIRLLPTNKKVELWNEFEMKDLKTEEETYFASVRARNEFLHKFIVDSCQSPFELKLKVGCQVMITKNGESYEEISREDFNEKFPDYDYDMILAREGGLKEIRFIAGLSPVKYVNGSMGTYIGKEQKREFQTTLVWNDELGKTEEVKKEILGALYLKVKLASGETVKLCQASWEFNTKKKSQQYLATKYVEKYGYTEEDFKEFDAQFCQFPLRLAYAITIHKSQGMTLDYCHIDCQGIFSDAMLYVALSRARSLEGLQVKGFSKRYVRSDKKAVEFYKGLEEKKENTLLKASKNASEMYKEGWEEKETTGFKGIDFNKLISRIEEDKKLERKEEMIAEEMKEEEVREKAKKEFVKNNLNMSYGRHGGKTLSAEELETWFDKFQKEILDK